MRAATTSARRAATRRTSRVAPPNDAGIGRLPNLGVVYFIMKARRPVEQVVLAVEGLGMWGTVYGFLALDRDTNTVRGLTYYDQKETPGLGGEIGNPKWQALWRGRKGFDDQWNARITVIKGQAGAPDSRSAPRRRPVGRHHHQQRASRG